MVFGRRTKKAPEKAAFKTGRKRDLLSSAQVGKERKRVMPVPGTRGVGDKSETEIHVREKNAARCTAHGNGGQYKETVTDIKEPKKMQATCHVHTVEDPGKENTKTTFNVTSFKRSNRIENHT